MPKVLLYNQYMRQVYRARLRDVYYVPYATIVSVPREIADHCPAYYSHNIHRCGAFFVLTIEGGKPENADDVLGSLYVDAASFENNDSTPVIPPPSGAQQYCRQMVDRPPNRAALRSCEHTILVLRRIKHIEKTKRLLEDGRGDREICSSLSQMEWQEILSLLGGLEQSGWQTLRRRPDSLTHIGLCASRNRSRIVRLDIELVADAFSDETCAKLADSRGRLMSTELQSALRAWATSTNESDARQNAASVFKAAWVQASQRYAFGPAAGSDGHPQDINKGILDYFQQLPEIEQVICATGHVAHRFYRDHLSHNVRAGLLALRLVDTNTLDLKLPADVNPYVVAFLAGLFHDVAFPVTLFGEVVRRIASVLTNVRLCLPELQTHSILDRAALAKSLSSVGVFVSVADMASAIERLRDGSVDPRNPTQIMNLVDPQLLLEEMLSANTEEHALIGAAALFNQIVSPSGDTEMRFDDDVKNFLVVCNQRDNPVGEFLYLLQCIALHDRRLSVSGVGVAVSPEHSPKPLGLKNHCLPVIVAVADELQEWGRPISAPESMSATDALITWNRDELNIELPLSEDPAFFRPVEFSVLEFLGAKLRILAGLLPTLRIRLAASSLRAFRLTPPQTARSSVTFKSARTLSRASPGPRDVESEQGQYRTFIVPRSTVGSRELPVRDMVVLAGDTELTNEFVRRSSGGISRVSLISEGARTNVEILLGQDLFSGTVSEYFHGDIGGGIPHTDFVKGKKVSYVKIELSSHTMQPSKDQMQSSTLHLVPAPHYMDYDWRFSSTAGQAIVEFVRSHRRDGKICYLACPTLALWHHRLHKEESDAWMLLDRGHYALREWLRKGLLPKSNVEQYDVLDILPTEHVGKYDVVVTDPPWYISPVNFYHVFCLRGQQLVHPGGLLGVTGYPYATDLEEKMKKERISEICQNCFGTTTPVCSLEICYDAPPFEKSWNGHKRYEHSGLIAYRPAYLDFYEINGVAGRQKELFQDTVPRVLGGEEIDLSDGNYLRVIDADHMAGLGSFPWCVSIERREKVKRLTWMDKGHRHYAVDEGHAPPNLVAWSTTNVLVFKCDEDHPARDKHRVLAVCDVSGMTELVKKVKELDHAESLDGPVG
ncbi:MAG: hypothetical protein WC712_13500, partial [Candidatus Brocadiia bacterium]